MAARLSVLHIVRTLLPGTHIYQMLSKTQDLVRLEGFGTLKKFIHLIGSRPHDFRLLT
jgi:hypothetical protein